MNVTAQSVNARFKALANGEIAAHSQRFFKTGKGEYGEGDKFLGIRVPVIRKEVKAFRELPLGQVSTLLKSQYHEVRLFALLAMVERFKEGSEQDQQDIYKIYFDHMGYINNWDLIDSSAPCIVGGYLSNKERSILYQLACSDSLWHRRIAIMATFYFIKDNDFGDALKIAKLLLNDREDLIHKAVGWMLREVGNRNIGKEESFLKQHYQQMPRTMLRYAIEKFDQPLRRDYLEGRA